MRQIVLFGTSNFQCATRASSPLSHADAYGELLRTMSPGLNISQPPRIDPRDSVATQYKVPFMRSCPTRPYALCHHNAHCTRTDIFIHVFVSIVTPCQSTPAQHAHVTRFKCTRTCIRGHCAVELGTLKCAKGHCTRVTWSHFVWNSGLQNCANNRA